MKAVPDPAERLEQAVSALVAWMAAQPARGSAHARRSAPGRRPRASSVRVPDVASIHRPLAALQNRVEEIIAAARATGNLPSHTDPALAARFTITLVLGVRGQLGGGADRDRVAGSLRAFLLAGLGAAEAGYQPLPNRRRNTSRDNMNIVHGAFWIAIFPNPNSALPITTGIVGIMGRIGRSVLPVNCLKFT